MNELCICCLYSIIRSISFYNITIIFSMPNIQIKAFSQFLISFLSLSWWEKTISPFCYFCINYDLPWMNELLFNELYSDTWWLPALHICFGFSFKIEMNIVYVILTKIMLKIIPDSYMIPISNMKINKVLCLCYVWPSIVWRPSNFEINGAKPT